MKRFFFGVGILFILILLILLKLLSETITGLIVGGMARVGVGEKLDGEITALIFDESIELGEMQKIFLEFANVGSTNLAEKMEIRIYHYNETGKLYEEAYYYDSQAKLYPGMRRVFEVSFLPQKIGVYYLKVRVEYDSRVKERWGAFLVIYTPPPPPIQVIGTPSPVYAAPQIIKEIGRPKMSIEYPRSAKIAQGEKKLLNISVKNIGRVTLKNLRLYVSTTSLINFEVSPKQIFDLPRNESVLFLLWIEVPENSPEGEYPFEFEVVSDKVKQSGSIELEVISPPPTLKEEVYKTILSYEYMILEVQNEIDSAALRGVDVSLPLNSLNKARISLEKAKKLYEREKYEDAKEELIRTKGYLMEAVYQLASASLTIFMPAIFPQWFILIAILIGAGFSLLLVLLRRKKKEKERKPKFLKQSSETET
jgi:hypothetical protein